MRVPGKDSPGAFVAIAQMSAEYTVANECWNEGQGERDASRRMTLYHLRAATHLAM